MEEYAPLEEIVLLDTNIRGINALSKQEAFYKVIGNEKPHIVCLNETKLRYDLFLSNYWSYQTMFDRKGGCWTAARCEQNVRLQLVKALGNYLCWTRLTTGNIQVQILNCYLECGESLYNKNRALRILEIVRDILRQDANAAIVICGDFNNHLPVIEAQLAQLNFIPALSGDVATHKYGNQLDQVYAKNIDITNAVINDELDH